MRKPEILLAESDQPLRAELRSVLVSCGLKVVEAADADAVLRECRPTDANFDLLIIASRLRAAHDGLAAVRPALASRPGLPVILIACESSEELAIAALRAGCADYLRKPLAIADVLASVKRHLPGARGGETDGPDDIEMIGDSTQMRDIRSYLRKVASTETSALITGETGTGKDLAARMLHRHSGRRQKPFVCINCAAIPDGLLESELFGYERGAFTGAQNAREGTLKQADGGTVFFDEIGDMSPYAQAKVLRAIEAGEARPLGARRDVAFDIRVVAATNRDLDQLMAEKRFRADLFFRLNVANIHLPPLRMRKEDLVPLTRHYIASMNDRSGLDLEWFSPETFDTLMRYSWPGNVRELKNLIEAVFIEPPPRWISFGDLPEVFRKRCQDNATLPDNERDRVLSALMAANWNKSQAAQKLQWSRMTLYRKMSRYELVNEATMRRKPDKHS